MFHHHSNVGRVCWTKPWKIMTLTRPMGESGVWNGLQIFPHAVQTSVVPFSIKSRGVLSVAMVSLLLLFCVLRHCWRERERGGKGRERERELWQACRLLIGLYMFSSLFNYSTEKKVNKYVFDFLATFRDNMGIKIPQMFTTWNAICFYYSVKCVLSNASP